MKKEYEQLNSIQRTQLQTLLKVKKSLSEISKEIGVSRQTLYRELLRNSYTISLDKPGIKSSCIHYIECRRNNKSYRLECPKDCIKYQPGRQSCLKKYPFVCNNCCKRKHCQFLHFYYDSEHASTNYHERISDDKKVPKTNLSKINKINKIISPLVKKGQSIEAILMNHSEIKFSSLTIRNWIKQGLLDCKLSEFRMTGRRIPSKQYDYSKKKNYNRLSSMKIGHKYNDYRLYLQDHPNSLIVQLDTVIGCIDGNKSILTIHIVNHKFQFGIILEHHTKEEVFDRLSELFLKLKYFENKTGLAIYSSFTELILTDNGPEFDALLNFCNSDPNIHIFFCHPLSSFEKGSCERNHVLVRYIHYKGWSFDNLNQDDVDLLFSNINSYPRKSLQNKTPYQSVLDDPRLGKEFLDIINISKVNGDDVILNPSLLKKIKK